MNGFIIEFKPFTPRNRVQMNHTLFGRIMHRKCKGKTYAYYVEGMLNNTPFYRLANSKIFVTSIQNINFEELRSFGDIKYWKSDMENIDIENLKTSEKYWFDHAKEKNITLKRQKNGRKKR